MKWTLPNDKHTWAFYYWLKRKGEDVEAYRFGHENKVTIVIKGL